MVNMIELELIDVCFEGDWLVQKELYDCYFCVMYIVVYWIVFDFDFVNDILQEVFVKVFRYLLGFC